MNKRTCALMVMLALGPALAGCTVLEGQVCGFSPIEVDPDPDDPSTANLTEEFLDDHPALASALRGPRNVELPCDEGRTTMRDLESEGADLEVRSNTNMRAYVMYENTTYQLILGKSVH